MHRILKNVVREQEVISQVLGFMQKTAKKAELPATMLLRRRSLTEPKGASSITRNMSGGWAHPPYEEIKLLCVKRLEGHISGKSFSLNER